MDHKDVRIDQRITWLHEMRGGYGYIERVPGKIVGVTSKRVHIQVNTLDGTPVKRSVKAEKLELKN